MRTLFEKDLRLILIRKSTLVIYLIIGLIFTFQFSNSFSGAYMTMIGTLLAVSTISYDDADNCMEFLLTLPCTRKQYVAEKYLFVYGFSLVAGIIAMIIVCAACLIKNVTMSATMFAEILASEIPILLIVSAIMIPLQLKFGAEKARIVLMVLFGGILAIGVMLNKIVVIGTAFDRFIGFLETADLTMVAIAGIAVLIVINVVSYMTAVKFVENKEY